MAGIGASLSKVSRLVPFLAAAAMLTALSACGQSEDQIRKDEREKVLAEMAAKDASGSAQPSASAAPSPEATASPAANAPSASASSAADSSWTGRYDLISEGATGDVTISAIRGETGRFNVSVGIGAEGCAGGTEGVAVANGPNRLVLTSGGDQSSDVEEYADSKCRIEFTRQAGRRKIEVAEDYAGCRVWHGAACSFNGEMTRK